MPEEPPVINPPTPPVNSPPPEDWSWAGKEGKLNDGWADRLPDTEKVRAAEYVALAGKYGGDISQILKGALNLQTIAGRKIGAPGADWTPEQITEYRTAHGVPETSDKYDLTPAEGALPEGVTWNPEVFSGLKDWAHKNHVPASAVKEVTGVLAGIDKARQQAAIQMIQDADTKTIEDLKKEFGPSNFEQSVNDGHRAAKFLGLETDPNKNPIANHPEFIKAMARVAKHMGESKLATIALSGASEQPGKMRAAAIMDPKGNDPLTNDYQGHNGIEKQIAAQKVLMGLLAES